MTRLTSGRSEIALIQFPGSNCDADMVHVFKSQFGINLQLIWHTEASLPKVDGVILPGGFSYGDYLRSGALASHSPVMGAVKAFAMKGGPVLGICNGFQILTESHLLPGALLRNKNRLFVCRQTYIRPANGRSVYHQTLQGKVLQVPIAHGEGRFYIDQDGLKRLEDQGQVLFQYATATGEVLESVNPNGTTHGIAGIVSENGRVMGMMPHPERAADQMTVGSGDGRPILEAFLATLG